MSKILVLGATGMLGHATLRLLSQSAGLDVVGTARSPAALRALAPTLHARIRTGVDAENVDAMALLLSRERPQVVINCIGLVKQLAAAEDPLAALPINALLPHRLSRLCALAGARFVHISTDCVFAGGKGAYVEDDLPDAGDLYGRSKLLGEVTRDPHAITLRTSIIGHELSSAHGLIGWFLAQSGSVKGFARAVFSGLPTVVLAGLIRDHVLPRPELTGLYHVSAEPIDKLALLRLVAKTYGKTIDIIPDSSLVIDRSLDSSRLRAVTGWTPPAWPQLVAEMHAFG